jgi:hypothetical protein
VHGALAELVRTVRTVCWKILRQLAFRHLPQDLGFAALVRFLSQKVLGGSGFAFDQPRSRLRNWFPALIIARSLCVAKE